MMMMSVGGKCHCWWCMWVHNITDDDVCGRTMMVMTVGGQWWWCGRTMSLLMMSVGAKCHWWWCLWEDNDDDVGEWLKSFCGDVGCAASYKGQVHGSSSQVIRLLESIASYKNWHTCWCDKSTEDFRRTGILQSTQYVSWQFMIIWTTTTYSVRGI